MRLAPLQPLHTTEAPLSRAGRHLLAASSSAQTTYIALAAIGAALLLLTATCCLMQRRLCGACARKGGGGGGEGGEKDVDLTSVLTGSQVARGSTTSVASSPGRMARAVAFEAAGGGGGSGPLPPLPGWRRPDAAPAAPAARGRRKPAASMDMLASYRTSAAAAAAVRPGARRPGGLPTIPSVTSMGSASRSELSDAAAGGLRHLAFLTDPSMMNSQTGAAPDAPPDAADARTTPTPQGTPRRVREALGRLERGGESLQGSPDAIDEDVATAPVAGGVAVVPEE